MSTAKTATPANVPSNVSAPREVQGTLPADELTILLDALRRGTPWRDALQTPGMPTLSAKPDWFTNEAKAGFYLMLAGPTDGLAIDVGAGSGVIAGALTSRFRRVVALERDPRWCEFMRRRYAQDNVPVEVIQGTALDIPETVRDADLVVVNGVLEWVAHSTERAILRKRPWTVQLSFLRGVKKTLRRGGRIGIAIENRWFYENFRGTSPHGEPPYAAVMPRSIAGLMTRFQQHEPYRTWIYGTSGYRRLLAAAGFTNIEIRAAVPSYHRPVRVMSLSNARAIRAEVGPRAGPKARVLDVLARVGLLGYAVHSFYISAERP